MNKKQTSQPALEDLLLALRRKIIESMRKDDLSHNLTLSQSEALRMIGVEEAKTMKDIAKALNITPPSATALIEEMERKELIVREKNIQDRRIVSIRLTKKAQKLFSQVCLRKKLILNRMLKKLSGQDRKTFERIIGIIISK
jgi:DNA-binding MarR family transcriptional regulator